MLIKDGKAQMPFGVMGGSYQACGHVHLLTNLIDYDMDLRGGPVVRVFPDVDDPKGRVQVEPGLPIEVLEGFRARGTRLMFLTVPSAVPRQSG